MKLILHDMEEVPEEWYKYAVQAGLYGVPKDEEHLGICELTNVQGTRLGYFSYRRNKNSVSVYFTDLRTERKDQHL